MPKDKKTLAFVIRRTYRIVVDSSHRDVAQPGSAFAWGASGRWFESSHPDQNGSQDFRLNTIFSLNILTFLDWRQNILPYRPIVLFRQQDRPLTPINLTEKRMRDKILIYRDYGCSDLNALEYGLKEYFEPRGGTVDFTDAAGIIKEGSLNESVLAFFMPGGAGTPFRRKLEVLGNEKIREYVRDGGIYYGICAGAYYACRETVFEEDIPELRIISSCGLNLVEGRAVGTLYKEFGIRPYAKDAASTAAVNLIWQDQEQHTVYYHGGPYFDLAANTEPDILAVYDTEKKLPAIIRQTYGNGQVILSGVHYEDKGAVLQKTLHHLRLDSAEALQVAAKLSAGEPSRLRLFHKMMSLTGR